MSCFIFKILQLPILELLLSLYHILYIILYYIYINYIDTKTEEEINNKWNYHVCLVWFTYCTRILDIYVHIIS